MSTDLEQDLRAAFDELAATTTISPNPRFGDITTRPVGDPRRNRGMLLAAAAVVLALVGGLGLLVRDRTAEAPAPAATTAPASEPAFFLFPDAASDERFADPRTAVDAYLADRMTTSPPGQTVTYTVNQDGPPFDGSADRVTIGFSLTVTPDDPSLCCDSGDGVARVQRVGDTWFVMSAEITAMQVHTLGYTGDGVLSGAFDPRSGGTYTVTVDDVSTHETEAQGTACVDLPDPTDPTEGPTCGFTIPDLTAAAVAVRIWHSPGGDPRGPRAMFAEFIVLRGADNVANISLDPSPPATTAPPVVQRTASGFLVNDTYPTPIEAAGAYLTTATEGTAELVAGEYLPSIPGASIAPTGRLFMTRVDPGVVVTRENEAWVRFTLVGAGGETDGVVRLVDTAWGTGAEPAWAVSYAGTRNVTLASATYRDRLVRADFTTDHDAILVRWIGAESGGPELNRMSGTTYEVGLGADAPANVALTVWSQPGDEPAFAEVVLTEGGEAEPRDFGTLFEALFGPDAQVTVPAFLGLTEGQARTLADELGLALDLGTTPLPAGDPKDATVVAQAFAPGTVTARGTTVSITLAQAEVG